MFAAPNVHAGTFVWKTTDANGNTTAQSPVYSGGSTGGGDNGPNSSVTPAPFTSDSYYVGNAGYAGYSSGGCNADAQGHATGITMTASGPLTATFTWQPASPGDSPPANVVIYQDCRAALTNYRNGICGSSVCTDGLGGSATLPFSGMQAVTESHKYSVEVPKADGTVSVSCSPNAVYQMSCSPSSGSYAAGEASVSYTASIVSGGWAGPYYLHNGSKTTVGSFPLGGPGGPIVYGAIVTPWANNTAGSTPTTQDNADTANGFLFQESIGPELHNGGNITPVWYWTGPDLGMPPPPFEIDLSAEAYANDDANSWDTADVADGLGDDPTDIPGGNVSQGSEFSDVTVQSDEAAPEEGNGYWAIGPTITLKANIDAPVNESSPYSLLSSVNISAVISSGLNN